MRGGREDPYEREHRLRDEEKRHAAAAQAADEDLHRRYAVASSLAAQQLGLIEKRAVAELQAAQMPLVPLAYVATTFGRFCSLRPLQQSDGCWPLDLHALGVDAGSFDGATPPSQVVATVKGLRVLSGRFYRGGQTIEHSLRADGARFAWKTVTMRVDADTYVVFTREEQSYPLYCAPDCDRGQRRDLYLTYDLDGNITYHSPADLDGDFGWCEPFESVLAKAVVSYMRGS